MNARPVLVALLVFVATVTNAGAHRLDEYLQATRISVEFDSITTEINLTPGAEVADGVFLAIDRDRDGRISPTEGRSYAEHFVKSLALDIDGQKCPLTLDTHTVPSLADMRLGEGVIRLRATTRIPAAAAGRHRLRFSNTHRSDIGVYLINALVPTDERIHITGQSRDMLQHEFNMDYVVSARERETELAGFLPPILGLALAAGLYSLARRFN
jgi:hypothetical protein